MTNKEIVQEVNEGFAEGNNEKILKHVADEATWEMPGAFFIQAKKCSKKKSSMKILSASRHNS